MTTKRRQANTGLLDTVAANMLGGMELDIGIDNSLRVERLLLEMLRPDPVQPRRVLPERIYQRDGTASSTLAALGALLRSS